MTNEPVKLRSSDIIYADLCYQINGILFEVFRTLGPGHLEKHYEKAIVKQFTDSGVNFKEQFYIPVEFKDKFIGKRFVDILVNDKIVIEVKKGQFVPALTISQTLDYLKILNLKLGFVACFTSKGVFIKRVLNLY